MKWEKARPGIVVVALILCAFGTVPAIATEATVFFVNGVLNKTCDDARTSAGVLEDAIVTVVPLFTGQVETACVRSGGLLSDLLESAGLLLLDDMSQFWSWVADIDIAPDWIQAKAAEIASAFDTSLLLTDPDLQDHVRLYRGAIDAGRVVVVVAHSEGNFYANKAYRIVVDGEDGLPPRPGSSIGIVAVATPAAEVGDGRVDLRDFYTTHVLDEVILAVIAILNEIGSPLVPLTPHTLGIGHAFVSTYLKEGSDSRARILNQIVALLGSLKPITPVALAWTPLAPTGLLPPGRTASSGVYDAVSNKLIIFGGHTGFTNLDDTWVLANATGVNGTPAWTSLNPGSPIPAGRAGHSAVYDAANKRMIVFGGNTITGTFFASTFLNDVWVLANATSETGASSWTELLPLGAAPSPRTLHTAVYDPTTNRMIVFGGGPGGGSELWVLENANGLGGTPNWIQLNATGGPPQARSEHTAVYNAAANRMLVFGGSLGSSSWLNDFWILSNANGVGGTPTWSAPIVTGTPPALGLREHTAVYDAVTDTMVVFGGELFIGCCAGATNRTWKLANASALGGTPTWTELTPSGPLPAPRVTAVGAHDRSSARMIIFGGGPSAGVNLLNDTWILVGVVSASN